MKNLALFVLTGGLVAGYAIAQDRGKAADGIPPVQPPPAMNDAADPQSAAQPKADPNAKTIPLANSDAEAKAAAAEARRAAATPVPVLPPQPEKKFDSPGLPPEVQKAAEATELPVITVRQEGNETIEEYRKNGKLYAQHFISKEGGPSKWYVDQRYKGPMPPDPAAGISGHVTPVEYKLFEWK